MAFWVLGLPNDNNFSRDQLKSCHISNKTQMTHENASHLRLTPSAMTSKIFKNHQK